MREKGNEVKPHLMLNFLFNFKEAKPDTEPPIGLGISESYSVVYAIKQPFNWHCKLVCLYVALKPFFLGFLSSQTHSPGHPFFPDWLSSGLDQFHGLFSGQS